MKIPPGRVEPAGRYFFHFQLTDQAAPVSVLRLSGLDGGSLFLDLLVVIGLHEREPDDGRENKGQDGEDHAGDAALRSDKGADGVRAVPQVELDARDGGKRDDLREDVGHDGKDDALKPHRQHQQGVPGDGAEDDGLVDIEDAGHDAGTAKGLQLAGFADEHHQQAEGQRAADTADPQIGAEHEGLGKDAQVLVGGNASSDQLQVGGDNSQLDRLINRGKHPSGDTHGVDEALQEAEEHEADRRGQSTLQRHKDGLHSTGNIDTGDLNDQPAARDQKHDWQQGVKPLTNEVGNDGILFEERELSERTKDQTNDNASEDGNEHTVGTVQGVALAHFLRRLRVDADHKEHHAREAREDALLTEALFLAVVKGDQEGGHQADLAHRPAEGSPEAGQSGNVVVQDGADAEDRACQNEGQQLHHRVLDDHDPSQVRDLLQFRRERIFEPFNEFIHWFPPHLCCRWSAALFSAGPLPCLVP